MTVERSRGFDLIERNNPCGERGGSVNEKVADEIRGNLRRSSVGGSLNKISFKREISRDKHYMRVRVHLRVSSSLKYVSDGNFVNDCWERDLYWI